MRSPARFSVLLTSALTASVLLGACDPGDLSVSTPRAAGAATTAGPTAQSEEPSSPVPEVTAAPEDGVQTEPAAPSTAALTAVPPPPTTESAAEPSGRSVPAGRAAERPSTGSGAPATSESPAEPPAGPAPGDAGYAAALVDGVNAERAAAGLPALKTSDCARDAAQAWAERLAASGSFEHQDVGAVMSACSARAAAENLVRTSDGPTTAVRLWMESAGHRANILDGGLTHVGSAAVRGADGQVTSVHVFLTL